MVAATRAPHPLAEPARQLPVLSDVDAPRCLFVQIVLSRRLCVTVSASCQRLQFVVVLAHIVVVLGLVVIARAAISLV